MKILAFESSCDETACAIVEDGRKVLCNVIASQIQTHKKTMGVVPEVAAREHFYALEKVFQRALEESQLSMQDIDAIAVTAGPGLLSSVMLAVNFASVLAFIHQKPLIPVNHIHGHISSCLLDTDDDFEFPIALLSVSGGHNDLYIVQAWNQYELLGSTQDDAAGEAYDKGAKMLGLDYPGGPAISRLASKGVIKKDLLPRPMLKDGYNFSFSGLKSALARLIQEYKKLGILESEQANLAHNYQNAINQVLTTKLLKACQEFKCKEVHLVGGVSANQDLRAKIQNGLNSQTVFRTPQKLSYCTDNAAMIASAAYLNDKSSWLKPNQVPDLIEW